jgi:hypothetical protein
MRRSCYITVALLLSAGCGKPSSDATRATSGPSGTPAADTAEASAIIDREVEAMWKKAGVTPAPDASDAEFLRRVTLDIAGRIPTPEEASQFLADGASDKRARLVDRLLGSRDYAVHWSEKYMDLMVGRATRFNRRFVASFSAWLETSFAEGKGLDAMTREMFTARGTLAENGALGFLASYKLRGGSRETLAGTTARVFLGLQIQCAQCHDHPTDKQWKQEDFASFAALFAEIRMPRADKKRPETTYADDLNFGFAAKPNAKRELKRAEPRFLRAAVTPRDGESRRDVLGRMIIASPLFARATVGFTWDQLFGRGIVEPWDDLGAENDPRQPALLRALGDGLARNKFSHRWLVRTIVLSKAYGRSSTGGAAPAGAAPDVLEASFARAAARPLSADQLFRSQLLATGIVATPAAQMDRWDDEKHKLKLLRQYLHTFEDDEGEELDAFTGTIPQALLLRNGALSNAGSRAIEGMVLARILAKSNDPAQRLESMYLTTYARRPDEAEKKQFVAYLTQRGNKARDYEDLFHALITSIEFTTNH